MINSSKRLSLGSSITKRLFDIFFSLLGLILLGWLILISALIAWVDTGRNGFFVQKRVGQYGEIFSVIKIRTMKQSSDISTTVTTSNDSRITRTGQFFRKMKIDELPQLFNVLSGQMSFVGPRPDVPGFADKLQGDEKLVLSLKPGITGPATLKYRNEETLLASQSDPEKYNREVIFPDKVRINIEYMNSYTFINDIKYIIKTIIE